MNLRLSHQAYVLIVIPLIFELAFLFLMWWMLHDMEESVRSSIHARKTEVAIARVLNDLFRAARALFLSNTQHDISMLEQFEEQSRQYESHIADLKGLTKADPNLAKRVVRLETLQRQGFDLLDSAKEDYESGDMRLLMLRLKRLQGQYDLIMTRSTEIAEGISIDQEKRELGATTIAAEKREMLQNIIYFGIGANLFLAAVIAFYFNHGLNRRLAVLTENTLRLARGESLLPRLAGNDELTTLDGSFHKVTSELIAAHNREREIVDQAVDVICSLSPDRVFLTINPAVFDLLGYTPDELRGSKLANLVTDKFAESTWNNLDLAIRSRHTVRFESQLKSKGGEIKDVAWSVSAPQSKESLFCIVHDISDRKEVERLKQDFIAMISHDLRTPIASVMIFLEALSAGIYGQLGDHGAQKIQALKKSVSLLVNMTDDLLDMEKLESGGSELHLESASLQDLIDTAIESVSDFARRQEVQLRSSCPDHITLLCDGEKVVRVIVNLVSNAVKFSESGQTVRVSGEETEDSVTIQVSDQGRGIPEELQSSIFDRWKQVNSKVDSGEKHGTGLGLAICKVIVEKHNGAISVESRTGLGSTFTIRIPKSKT